MEKNANKIRDLVRENYGKVVESNSLQSISCCTPTEDSSCCVPSDLDDFEKTSSKLGYSAKELELVPEGSNLGLGCGNPQAIANLKAGEIVLDLGSGAGFDVFLAAKQVGEKGKAIGVDMTAKMISKARENAEKGNFENVEFRLGEIENIPAANESVDAIISNCVINLSPEKQKVFNESYRVLKLGGRIAVSDILAEKELPKAIRENISLYSGCIAGAATIEQTKEMLVKAGFKKVTINRNEESKAIIKDWTPGTRISEYIVSARIEAVK